MLLLAATLLSGCIWAVEDDGYRGDSHRDRGEHRGDRHDRDGDHRR